MKKDDISINYLKSMSKSNYINLFFELIGDSKKIEDLINNLLKIKEDYLICQTCFYIKKEGLCFFCDEKERDKKVICIVSSLYDAYKIYNSEYKGLIHVLEERISPEIKESPLIEKLEQRIYNINELVIALNLTFEGEIVSNYIKNIFEKKVKKISRIAQGIPFGGSLNYADYETLSSAILNRKKIK